MGKHMINHILISEGLPTNPTFLSRRMLLFFYEIDAMAFVMKVEIQHISINCILKLTSCPSTFYLSEIAFERFVQLNAV
jgi:hypothetical protein